MRTGRCETFAEAAARMGERREQLAGLAGSLGIAARRHRHAPVEPLAGPADHRHAALPPQRRDPPLRRLAQQLVRAPRPRRHPRRRPGDPRPRRAAHLPAATCSRSRRARRSSRTSTPACTRRGRRSSRACSRAAACPTRTAAGTSSSATSASSTRPARSPSTRSSGGASARTSRSRPSRSGSATASRSSARRASLAALGYALTARIARALDEGEELPLPPHRLIEENLWRAIRYGLSGEPDRPRGRLGLARPARRSSG